MKTYMAKKGELQAKWHLVDVDDQILGRIATRIATVLMGKHRPEYTPNVDTGDYVIIINASKVRHTGGNKPKQRIFQHYSGYPSGRKVETLGELMEKDPARVVTEAIRRMLPKSKLGTAMLRKLMVYPGDQHPHQAQTPQPLDL